MFPAQQSEKPEKQQYTKGVKHSQPLPVGKLAAQGTQEPATLKSENNYHMNFRSL